MDSHYTPPAVADQLVAAVADLSPKLVADIAAGNGDLLFAAERKWPTAEFTATDIDRSSVRRLLRLRPSWQVGCCDLRNKRSRSSCATLERIRQSACLLLLNPPFSCRGGTRFLVNTNPNPIYASTAMSFLLQAMEYIADTGHIVSVLPLGCLYNQKDAPAWDILHSRFSIQTLRRCPIGTFPNSATHTVLVRLSPKPTSQSTSPFMARVLSPPPVKADLRVQMLRGCCPIHGLRSTKGAGPVLVHYTDLKNGTVELNGRRGHGNYRCVEGSAIIIPRVGNITRRKIAVLEARQPVMLSDCVIALVPENPDQVSRLKERLLARFTSLREQYVGTGAPFITTERLESFANSIGVEIAR